MGGVGREWGAEWLCGEQGSRTGGGGVVLVRGVVVLMIRMMVTYHAC